MNADRDIQDGRTRRNVRVQTPGGAIEGHLLTGPMVRTLDDLNMVSRNFLTIHAGRSLTGGWNLDPVPLAVSKATILFVVEMTPARPARQQNAFDTSRFSRAACRLWVGDHSIEGFFHVPVGGRAMNRLNQAGHPFLAMTSASIVGPDDEFAAPFLAVNRQHILAAQELVEEADEQPFAATTERLE